MKAVKVLSYPTNFPSLLTDEKQTFVGHACSMLGMEFQEHPLKGGQDIAQNVLCSPREVHFIID